MRPHFILSAFRTSGGYISPPGLWTPPSDRAAERLIAAKCIRLATDGEIKRLGPKDPEPETIDEVEQIAEAEPGTEPGPKTKAKAKSRRSKKGRTW